MTLRILALGALATAGLAAPAEAQECDRHVSVQVNRHGLSLSLGHRCTTGCFRRVPARPMFRRTLGDPRRVPARYYCAFHRGYHAYGRHDYHRPRAACASCHRFHPCWEYDCRRPLRRPIARPIFRRVCR